MCKIQIYLKNKQYIIINMKIPITKIKDVDNRIYEYVFYTEEQLKEFKEQHKINFYDVLEDIELFFRLN